MEFEINSFTESLISLFVNSKQMPDMNGFYVDRLGRKQEDVSKHKNRPVPRELKNQIQNCMKDTMNKVESMNTFDIGNEQMEKNFPYYHILQQAPVIRKRNQATKKSRGSQYGKSAKDIDYEIVSWNGKTYTKEYSRNVRGKRLNMNKTSYWSGAKTSDGEYIHPSAKQYKNIHYQYIDHICDEIAPMLAEQYGLQLKRKIDTGLGEEYFSQLEESPNNLLEILGSFEE